MSTYIAKWPNGDFSIVTGPNRLAIDEVLDEVGDPSCVELTRLPHAVAVHFKLKEVVDHTEAVTDWFDFEELDEQSLCTLRTSYPDLAAAFDGSEEEATPEKVKAAMRLEESRINVEPEISDDPQLANLQKMMGISKRMAEDYKRIADEIKADEKK